MAIFRVRRQARHSERNPINPLTTHEERKHARLDMALTVSYVVKNSTGGVSEVAEAMSSNISAGGLRLMTATPLEPGMLLELEINIDGNKNSAIPAHAEVVWQFQASETSYETGVVIKHMEESAKQRFLGFIFDQMSRVVYCNASDEKLMH